MVTVLPGDRAAWIGKQRYVLDPHQRADYDGLIEALNGISKLPRSHRAFRQLAIRLSRAGFPVLRFDYYGCGDSAGDSTEGSVDRWVDDIATAIDELRTRSGITRVYLAGLRLGATLATLLGMHRDKVEGLVLWDPIIDGAQYVEALIELHARWSRLQLWRPKVAAGTEQTREILGFPLTPAMEQGLRSIALAGMVRRPAQRALLVASTDKVDLEGFGRQLEGLSVAVDRRVIPWPEFWVDTGELQDVLMPPMRILQVMVSWVSEVCP